MKRAVLIAVSAVMCGAGCADQKNPDNPSQSTSTLALSSDDALLYAVDTDNQLVAVIDANAAQKIAEVKVGAGASLVTVGADDTVFVTNRYDGTVSVIRRGEWKEAARWKAGVEPVGLAVSRDGKTLFVISAVDVDTAEHGALLALDSVTGEQQWSLAVGNEPRSVTVVDNGHVMVTLLKEGDVQLVDVVKPEVVRAGTDMYDRMNRTSVSTAKQNPQGVDFQHARAVGAIAVSPDGSHVHALGVTARSGPQNAWGGCAGTQLAAPAIFSFDTAGSSLADDVFQCQGGDESVPRTVMTPPGAAFDGSNPNLIQGPSAIALERTGRWMYVAHQHSNNVALLSTVSGAVDTNQFFGNRQTVDQVIPVGRGPNGIAVRHDGRRAYVLNALDHTVSVLGDDGRHGIARLADVTIAGEALPADVVAGRKLFFDATDKRMTGERLGAACATCHIDNGQEDGHVWTFAEGERQTMSLAGGRLDGTAPFHWDGALENIDVLMQHTTMERMGGGGTTPEMAAQVSAYLASLPKPVNPAQRRELSASELRGKAVFQKAECGTCHAGEKLTNNGYAHVGTKEERPTNAFDQFGQQQTVVSFPAEGVNVPSLLGLARTAPYLHDGSAPTLRDRIEIGKAGDLHGKTAQLSDDEVTDLVAYLETL